MMKYHDPRNTGAELAALCASVRDCVTQGDYESCLKPICRAMEEYPHAPQPHNLMGILLEKTGDHSGAIKHFRAAWALDPGYAPAIHNLHIYGTFYSGGRCAFDESDVPPGPEDDSEVVYDANGVGRVVRRSAAEHGIRGIRRKTGR